jgi:Cu/Ag efflux protein CusF
MLEEYRKLSLTHEDIARMETRFCTYRFLMQSQKWMKEERTFDRVKINDILSIFEGLHITFQTAEIKDYRVWLEKLRDN